MIQFIGQITFKYCKIKLSRIFFIPISPFVGYKFVNLQFYLQSDKEYKKILICFESVEYPMNFL